MTFFEQLSEPSSEFPFMAMEKIEQNANETYLLLGFCLKQNICKSKLKKKKILVNYELETHSGICSFLILTKSKILYIFFFPMST